MPWFKSSAFASDLFTGTEPSIAKVDDRLCRQYLRSDGSDAAQQFRPKSSRYGTTNGLAPDGKPQSFPKKWTLCFRMRSTWIDYRDPRMSTNEDTDINCSWRPRPGCSMFHQLSVTTDTGCWFPTFFRQQHLVFSYGSDVPTHLTTIQRAVEQAHGPWFRLKQQLLSEFGVSESIKINPNNVQQDLPSRTLGGSRPRPVVHNLCAVDEPSTLQSTTSIPFPHRRHDHTSESIPAFLIPAYVTGLPGRLSVFSPSFLHAPHKAEADDPPPPPPPEPSPTMTDQ